METQPERLMPPAALRHARGWFWRWLGRGYLSLAGWKVEGEFPPEPKFVIIVAPHTSNWDFLLGIAIVFALELRVSWLGKHTIFKAPFRKFLAWLGGIPVDRRSSNGVVGGCVKAINAAPAMAIALSPEGTRRSGGQWKTGFYLIATKAGIPVVPVSFDFREHRVRFQPAFHPTGSLEEDLPALRKCFEGVHGLRTWKERRHPQGEAAGAR